MKKPSYFRSIADGRIIETSNPEFYNGSDYERIERKTGVLLKQEETRGDLLELLKPGRTVYSQIVNVSASGMQRSIKFFAIIDDKLINITHKVACVLGHKMHKNGGLIVTGCGMDMAFSVVYNIGRTLWGTETGQRDAGYSLNSQII